VFTTGLLARTLNLFSTIALAALTALGTLGSSQAQSPIPDAKLLQGLQQVDRFFNDWRRTRKPLTSISDEDRLLRTLVLDDLSSTVRRAAVPADSAPPRRTASGTPTELVAQIAEQMARLQGRNEFPIILRPSEEPTIGHTDCGTDYQCSCDTEHRYTTVTIPEVPLVHPRRGGASAEQLLEVWRRVPAGQIYACYTVSNHFEGFVEQRYCRFISRITKQANPDLLKKLGTHESFSRVINEGVVELAVESAVRVSPTTNLPIDRPSDYVRPVYALTDSGVVLFDEIYAQPRVRCALAKIFDQPVFSVSHCVDKDACAKKAITSFLQQLDQLMSASPVLATVDQSDGAIPGERIYTRNYERSEVLGQPFFESSQYIAKWYRNEGGSVSPPGLYTYSKGDPGHVGDHIFVNVRHSLSVRAGRNGPYPEANQQQYAAYQKAVATLVNAATKETCRSLSGQMIAAATCSMEHKK
jgi:hypothetical protein